MINFEQLTNFNNVAIARPEAMLVPQGTIAKVIMNIRSGGYEKDPYLTKSAHTGSIYLHAEFIVLEGPFSRRRIFQNIGIAGNNKTGDNDVFGARGRSLLRGLIESAKNIMPNDSSETASNARKINSFAELNGLICVVKIGIEPKWNGGRQPEGSQKDKSGKFDDRNSIVCAITPDKKGYQIFMNSALENNDVWI
jgi:hypothetical protein